MVRPLAFTICAAALAAAGLAMAATPSLFGKSRPGLWEVSGMEGSKVPARLCLADLSELARVEHRGRACKQRAIRETATSVTFTYECSGSDFGRSQIDYVTSKNFKIVSQGIAGGLPFAHTAQARRLGDCEPKSAPLSH
ncbi:MAG: DUF3617 family protein [Sphingomicrobium sp.]